MNLEKNKNKYDKIKNEIEKKQPINTLNEEMNKQELNKLMEH